MKERKAGKKKKGKGEYSQTVVAWQEEELIKKSVEGRNVTPLLLVKIRKNIRSLA